MAELPFVTIIIPTRNEEKYICACLEAVKAQDYPHDRLEVIVTDGMSSDRTREFIRAFDLDLISILIIDNPRLIAPTGLNAAILRARGDVIVRVDGHCEIAADYVSRCVFHLQKGFECVGGPMHTIGESPLSRTIAIGMSSIFGVGNSAFRTTHGMTRIVDTVPFQAYDRSVIGKAGLYDEELVRNQDDEYNYRLRELGVKILLAADVKSAYYSRGSLMKLWKQYYQYGFYKVRVLQKHPRQMSLRQFVPPAFVFALLVTLLAVLAYPPFWPLPAAVLAAYLLANLSASCFAAGHKGWANLPLLPLVYAILHLSYGLGFLAGLVKFANRWGDRQGKVPVFTSDHA